MSKNSVPAAPSIFGEIKSLIEQSKNQVALSVNATMTMLYWQIGKRINEEALKEKRAEYGKQIVATLSRQLVGEYGESFSENLRRMMQMAEVFPGQGDCRITDTTIELDSHFGFNTE